jgi:hypothetical protein
MLAVDVARHHLLHGQVFLFLCGAETRPFPRQVIGNSARNWSQQGNG